MSNYFDKFDGTDNNANYFDKFDATSEAPDQEQGKSDAEGFWGETLDYVQDRAGDFAGYAGRAASKAVNHVGNNPALGAISPALGLMQEPEIQQAATAVGEGSQQLIDKDFGFDAQNNQYSWERVKENKDISTLAGYVAREGLGSAPEMLAMLTPLGLGAYGASATERLAEDRAKNNGNQTAGAEDYAVAAPTAVATVLLDRLGFDGALKSLQGGALKNIGKSTAREAGTEFLQESLESTATTLGTEQGFDLASTLDQGLAGAVAGAGMGAAINTGSQAVESFRGNPNNPDTIKAKFESDIARTKDAGQQAVARGESPDIINALNQQLTSLNTQYNDFLRQTDPNFVESNVNRQEEAKASVAAQGGDALDQAGAAANVATTLADDVNKDNLNLAKRQAEREAERQEEARLSVPAYQRNNQQEGLMSGAIGDALIERDQVSVNQMETWRPNFTMPGNEQEQAQQVEGEYIANTDYPTSVPLGNNLGFDPSVGAIDGIPGNRIPKSDTIFAGEQREELPAPQRQALPDKVTGVIAGQDRTAELDAQEQMRQGRNAPRQIEQKDIIFATDESISQGTERATIRSNGNPFPTVKSVQASRSYRNAVEQGINPEIVRVGQGFGWETSEDVERDTAPKPEAVAPIDEVAQESSPSINEGASSDKSLINTGRLGKSERPTKAITPQGREVGVEYRVVDASEVINSNDENGTPNPDFPQEYQNRNRGRTASTQQIRNIANKLNPEQVDYGNMSTDGAPIVSPDGIVESGNGRVAGIKLAYKQGKANEYREYLEAQGYDTEGLQEPVLVRVRTTEMTPDERRQFVTESNERTTLSLSATEKAKDDATAISRIATDYMGGDVDNVANAGFVRKFMQGVSSTEAAELVDADGRLSQTGKRRIEAALLFNAYGDERVVTDLFESSDNDIKSIGGALLDNAGQWSKMRQQAPTELDMTNNVIEAVNLVKQARREGRSVQELVGQQDIFSGEIPLETERALKMMYGPDLKRAVSRKALSEKLGEYATLASNVNPEPGLFGDEVGSVTSNDLMDQINGTESTTENIQTGLFDVESDIEGSAQREQSAGNDPLTEDNQSLREPESIDTATLEEPPEGGFFTPEESEQGDTPMFRMGEGVKEAKVEQNGLSFETGKPVTFPYLHNKDSATSMMGIPDKDSPYGRGYEPSAKYVTLLESDKPDYGNFETGDIAFNNPLVIENDGLAWKKSLSDSYDGKTGKELSNALIADGYDGIVTVDGNSVSEIVDFTSFDESAALFSTPNDSNPTTTRNRTAVSPTDANKVIDSIVSSWTGGIKARRNEIESVASFDDLPNAIKNEAKAQGVEGQVYGVFHNGKTYVVLDKHDSTQEIETTIFHETYGHHGMQKLFGNKITQKMNQLFVANGGMSGLRKTAEKHGIDLKLYEEGTEQAGMSKTVRNRVLMEELLAHMQQDNKPSVKRMAKEVVGYIRQKLRDLGFAQLASVSDSDLFYILKQSRDAVKKGSAASPTNFITTVGSPSISNSLKKWLGKSKIVDSKGMPITMYHGTKVEGGFDVFKPSRLSNGLIYTTQDAKGAASNYATSAISYTDLDGDSPTKTLLGGSVMPIYVRAEKPYNTPETAVSSFEAEGDLGAEKLKSMGYDSIYVQEFGSAPALAVVSPGQIKSAIGNNGDYSRDSDNIMFRAINEEPDTFTAPVEKKWSKDWFKRKLQDKFAPIKDMQASIEAFTGQELPEDQDTYRAEELFYGKTENDLNKVEDNHVKPLVDVMTQNNIESGELDQYLIAKHAEERNAHIASINPEMPDGGSGMTNAEADEILARYAQEGKLAGLSIAANEVYKITEKRRELLRESGLEDEALLDVWDANYQFYVPLKGYADDSEGKQISGTGKGFDIRGRESMRAMGRRTIAESPTAHAIQDLSETIIRARKNEVGKTFLNMVEANPNPDIWEVFTDENPDTERRIVNGEVKENQPIDMRSRKDDYFSVKIDGKSKYVKLKDKDKLLISAMKNMGPEQMNTFTKSMGAVTRWLSMVNTSLNPEFAITNAFRDIQTATFNALAEQDLADGKVKGKKIAKSMALSAPGSVKALWKYSAGKLDSNDPMNTWIEEFLADGAKTGYFDSKEVDKIGTEMADLLDMANGTNKGKLLKAKNKIGNFVEGFNGGIENGVRLSAYIEARRAGVSRNKAASFSKNLTVNFNKRGSAGATLNSLYMFFNAAVQGNTNFARAILTPKEGGFSSVEDMKNLKLNTAQKVAAGITASAYAWASWMREIGGDDEDGVPYWDKIPKGVRERNFIIPKTLYGGEPGEYLKIPLPYGYNIFYNLGDAAEAAVNSETRKAGDLMGEMALSVYASFVPLGSPVGDNAAESFKLAVTPTMFKPIVEIDSNKNFFGGPIYRENSPYGPQMRDSQMSMKSTGQMYKNIAQFMNDVIGDGRNYKVDGEDNPWYDVSPDSIEHLVEFSLGGLYRFGSRVQDNVLTAANGGDLSVTEIPFARQLNGEVRPYADINQFYDARQQLKNIDAELKSLRGQDRIEFRKEYGEKLRLNGLMGSLDKRMKLLRKQRDRVEIDDSLSFTEREDRLQEIEDKMKTTAAQFNRRWNKVD